MNWQPGPFLGAPKNSLVRFRPPTTRFSSPSEAMFILLQSTLTPRWTRSPGALQTIFSSPAPGEGRSGTCAPRERGGAIRVSAARRPVRSTPETSPSRTPAQRPPAGALAAPGRGPGRRQLGPGPARPRREARAQTGRAGSRGGRVAREVRDRGAARTEPLQHPRPALAARALPRRLARTMPFFCSTNVDPFTRLDTTATPRPRDTAAGLGLRAPSPAAAAAAAAVPMPPARPRACASAPRPEGGGSAGPGAGPGWWAGPWAELRAPWEAAAVSLDLARGTPASVRRLSALRTGPGVWGGARRGPARGNEARGSLRR